MRRIYMFVLEASSHLVEVLAANDQHDLQSSWGGTLDIAPR